MSKVFAFLLTNFVVAQSIVYVQGINPNQFPNENAEKLLGEASGQWGSIDLNSAHVQGNLKYDWAEIVNGRKQIVMDSNVQLCQNRTGKFSIIRIHGPTKAPTEVFLINPSYFAILEKSGTSQDGIADLTYFGWLNKSQDPPVDHANWNSNTRTVNLTKPYYFDLEKLDLRDLVGNPDFELRRSQFENDVLEVEFSVRIANKGSQYQNITGGRLELVKTPSIWLPRFVELDIGTLDGKVYFRKALVIEYIDQGVIGNEKWFPLISRKNFHVTCVRKMPGSQLEPGFEETQVINMDLRFQNNLPADNEFRLSAFGLPEPEKPQSRVAFLWKLAGGIFFVGVVFALLSRRFGSNT